MLKVVNPAEQLQTNYDLNCSISIPSYTHIYSVATEYIRQWFLSKFNNNFFKTVNMNEKHILDELRIKSGDEMIKQMKPKLSITPSIDYDYDKGTLNQNQFGLDILVSRGTLDRSFIKDFRRNLFIGMGIEELKFGYNFRMIFSTKATQLDVAKYINMAFSIGNTKTYPLDIDFHIPYSLMLQLAIDMNIGVVEDNKITNIFYFLNCLNHISELPIMYKFNTLNGNHEFYIRMRNSSIHINMMDKLSIDEGEYEGMLKDDFGIEFNIEVLIPAPKLYAYYSKTNHNSISLLESSGNQYFEHDEIRYTIELSQFPEIDENNWNQYLTTQYHRDDNVDNIDFTPLFEELNVLDMIKYHNSIGVNPSTFINIKMYSGNKEFNFTIDWENNVVKFDPIHMHIINIALYMDTRFITDFNTNNYELLERYKKISSI